MTHGAYGHPRCLCPSCEALLDTAIEGSEVEAVRGALHALSDLRIKNGDFDKATSETLTQIVAQASERMAAMEAGTYEGSAACEVTEEPVQASAEDEAAQEYDIPEELRELEEDRERDRIEDEREKAFDKYFRFVWIGVIAAFVAALVYILFFR